MKIKQRRIDMNFAEWKVKGNSNDKNIQNYLRWRRLSISA
jgi:hypothetical protein